MTRRLLAALVVLTLLTACGSEAAAPTSARPDAGPRGDYVADGLPDPFEEGDSLRVTFGDGEISFQATCNTMSGPAELENDVLVVSSVGGTEMGCPGAGFEQDEWLIDFFTSSPEVTVDGTDVRLTTDDNEIWMLPADEVDPDPGPDAALEGTDWRLTGLEETDGDSVGMTGVSRRLKARFEITGPSVTLALGCNSGEGRVEVRGDELRLRNVLLTVLGCLGLRREIEDDVTQVLLRRGWVDWAITGDQLRLTRGDTTLLYRAT